MATKVIAFVAIDQGYFGLLYDFAIRLRRFAKSSAKSRASVLLILFLPLIFRTTPCPLRLMTKWSPLLGSKNTKGYAFRRLLTSAGPENFATSVICRANSLASPKVNENASEPIDNATRFPIWRRP
jgi:hypothetical protein